MCQKLRLLMLTAVLIAGSYTFATAQTTPMRLEPGPLVPIRQEATTPASQGGPGGLVPLQQSLRPLTSNVPVQHVEPTGPANAEILPVPVPPPDVHAAVGPSLADFEGMALSSNPSIARASALVQAARGNWVQVGLKPNPTVGYEGQQLGSGGLAEQHGVFAEQEFVRGGKLRLNREVAAQEVARAERNLATQQQRVLTDVRIAYYNVLIAQQQEQLTRQLVGIAEQSVDVTNQLLRAQEVGRPDVLQAQIEIENTRILAINARNRRATAWQSLVTVAGQPGMPIHILPGDPAADLPRMEFGDVLGRLVTGSPEVATAIANVERSRWALERARVESVPNVTLQGMVNVIDNGIGGKPDANVMIGVPLPLWNRNQGGIVQAQGEVTAAERAVEQTELDLQNRLGPVFERYSNASNQVRRYQEAILPAAQESLDLTRRSYGAGEVGFVNLLTVQRTYSQTQLNYLQALRDLRESAAQLEGFLLSDSLQNR